MCDLSRRELTLVGQPLVCIARAKWHRRRPADACTPSAVIPMKLLSILLTVAVFGDGMPKANEDRYLETIRVSENVYVFKPKIDWVHGNGVAIIGSDGVFFIDTYIQFNYAEEAIRRLKRITNLPVTYVLNTHSHDDHTTGNGVFRRIFPASRLIVQNAAVTGLDNRVKAKVEGEAKF